MQTIGTTAARMDRLPVSKWHAKIMWILGLGVLADTLDIYIGGSILAALVASGWSNNKLNGVFISATMAGMFAGALLAGYIGDNLGRRKSLMVNLGIFGIASIAAAFVSDMTQLIVMRGIMGIGLGAQMAATTGSLPEYFPPQCRGRYSGLVGLIANVAPPITMGLSLLVIPRYGWRVLFFSVGVFALIMWAVIWKCMPESPRWYAAKGMLDKADAILTKVEGEIEAEKGLKLAPVVTAAMPESPKTVPYSAIFKGGLLRRTITLSAALIGSNVAIYTIVNWVPTIFVNAGISITKSLGMTVVMLIGAPVGVLICAMVADKVPRKTTLAVLSLSVGVLGYFYSLQRTDKMIMTIGFVMITVLYFYSVLIFYVYSGEIFPTESRLRGVGFCNAAGRTSSVVTPPVIAWILTSYGSVAVFVTVFVILAVIAFVIAVLGVETKKKSLEDINKNLLA